MAPQAALARVPESGRIDFVAFRDGSRIGTHTLRFREDGARLHVEIRIDFRVMFAFIPFYTYRHTNNETWEGDRLVRLETRTDDNGDEYRVSARAEGEQLIVEGSSGRLELPGDTLPTSYWMERMIEREQWLDTQKGRLLRSEVKDRGTERIEAASRRVEARRYTLAGDLDCDLWYHDGKWSKLRFDISGSTIDYVKQPPGEA